MSTDPNFWTTAIKMMAALATVLGVLLSLFYLSKRLNRQGGAGFGTKLIRIVDSRYVGPKKTITMVEVPGSILVLGTTQERISLLAQIDQPELVAQIQARSGPPAEGSFTSHLQRFYTKFKTQSHSKP